MATPAPTKTNKSGKGGKSSLLSDVLFKYAPYWPLFIVFAIVTLFGAWLYLRTTAPQYEIVASILLKDERRGSGDGSMINDLDQLTGKKIVENEIEVLQSKAIMYDVVRAMHLYANIEEKDKLIPRSAYTTSPVSIEAAEPDKVKTKEKIEFQFNAKDSQIIIGTAKYPMNQLVQTPWGVLKFVPNPHLIVATEKPLSFKLTPARDMADELLLGFRSTATTKQTTVLNLKIRDTDPKRGEDLLDELITIYNQVSINEKSRLAASTAKFVAERLDTVQLQLSEIEKKAEAYKSTQNGVDLSTQATISLQSFSATDKDVADVEMQLTMLKEVESNVRSKDNATGIVPSTLGLKDPTLTNLLANLYDKELTYEKLRTTTGENNPVLVSLLDQIIKLKSSLLENIESQKKALNASKLNLSATNNKNSVSLQKLPQKERELIDIQRQQTVLNTLYAFLLQKKEESDLANQSKISDIRVIDSAQASTEPVSPKPNLIYLVALIIAIILPIAFVSAKELLNRKVLFRHEIESLTSAPIIGEISFDKSKDPIVIQEGKRTFIAEQFRRMRASLGYLSGNSGKKKILVTSTLSSEGKSFVAVNLALSLALTNKKVALLEFDLANPSLSKKLDVEYDKGVSNYLWNECEPEDIIKRTHLNNNLFFIPSGPLPENPSELLMSSRVKDLLTYLEDVFDVIIIDSAPASLLSDAYVLSPLCDVTLYVVKHKFTPKVFLEKLDEENNNSGNQLTNMRIVFNGIRSRGFTKNGYGYGYGYGYIHNNTTDKKKNKKKNKIS